MMVDQEKHFTLRQVTLICWNVSDIWQKTEVCKDESEKVKWFKDRHCYTIFNIMIFLPILVNIMTDCSTNENKLKIEKREKRM